ncbi:unnamed protein product [Paramecium pentaurelia]|uniref:RING-type domain-containing protein n=1 Tax=Paramecium pentaurelia TaxID=43138 RepID=A0A8S1UR98_9CILI|nr:unnamed protein product [Paramecium pentaurelia]
MQETFDQLEIEIENFLNQFSDSFVDELIQNQNIQQISQLDNPQILNQSESQLEKEYIDVVRILNFEEVKVFIDELICPICSHILIDPRICLDCSQGFCKQCLSQWFNQYHSKTCPCCRSISNQPNDGSQAPKLLFKLLSKLKISCKYYNNGCTESICYDNKEKHYDNECEYRLIICQYCLGKIIKINSKTHFQECEFKPIQCTWCSQTFSYYDYQTHYGYCSFRTFKCTQCLLEYPFSQINNHTPDYCSKKQIKKFKNQYQQSKSEIQKTKQQLLEQMQKIKQLERFIKKQKLQKQENQYEISNNEQINNSVEINQFYEDFQLHIDPYEQQQQQFDWQRINIQEQYQDTQEKSVCSENYLEYPIQDVSFTFSDIGGTQHTQNSIQEEGYDK